MVESGLGHGEVVIVGVVGWGESGSWEYRKSTVGVIREKIHRG